MKKAILMAVLASSASITSVFACDDEGEEKTNTTESYVSFCSSDEDESKKGE